MTVARQTPLSREFPRQEHWSGLPYLSPGDLPDPGVEPVSPALQVDSLLMSHGGSPPFFCKSLEICRCDDKYSFSIRLHWVLVTARGLSFPEACGILVPRPGVEPVSPELENTGSPGWSWVWASSGSRWWTGKPGVLLSTGSQRVGHDWATELNCDRQGGPWYLFLMSPSDTSWWIPETCDSDTDWWFFPWALHLVFMFVLAENDLAGQLQRDVNLQGEGVVCEPAHLLIFSKHRPFLLTVYQIVSAHMVRTDAVGEADSGPCFCAAP